MIDPARPRLVQMDELEEYPIGRDERLDAHSFVKWWHHRWLSSRTFRLASWETQGMARALFDMSQTESPIGTLPDDDDELAVMLRVERRRIGELRRAEFGPFRGWRRCRCGDEVRLMHPVVLEQVRDALDRREAREMSREAAAVRKRRERLRDGLGKLGLSDAILGSDLLIERMDEWMLANVRGRRDGQSYGAALLHARRERWL
ncbi:hypothetical protein SDC9_25129 [bioreactor metagenome]|uniref:Uncharacterized protein n=2 Tax=root TaxID=1 RepID=A0A443L8A3_9RHOB|nr:hypothetical protein [Sinirhodobacter ferrireducens]RWR45208.1 hypothetical protein EOW65_16655 [Sinirhodobacter ferrireducens]